MVCLYCGGKLAIVNSRSQKRVNQTWRRRRCRDCLRLYTTHEALYLPAILTVIRGGKPAPFLPDKLYTEILLALQDRPDCYEAARALTSSVISQLIAHPEQAIPATDISTQVAKTLKRFNRRAYLRYSAEHPSVQGLNG